MKTSKIELIVALLFGATLGATIMFPIIDFFIKIENVEPKVYEAVVIKNYDDEIYLVDIKGEIYALYSDEFRFYNTEKVAVVIVDVKNWNNKKLAIPYIEYLAQDLEGQSLGLFDECGGLCWYKE